MTIQYFPGHMAKTIRQIEEHKDQIDVIYELRDARAPKSSQNPIVLSLLAHKPRIQIWTKADLADLTMAKRMAKEESTPVLIVNVLGDPVIRLLAQATKQLLPDLAIVRALVIGIPNVGKSTLINQMGHKAKVRVENRPGVTRHLQWITMSPSLRLLDTPGLLWQKFEDPEVALRLAALGMIPDTHFPRDDVYLFIAKYFFKHYPETFRHLYQTESHDPVECMTDIARTRGLLRGNRFEEERVYDIVRLDLQKGKLGRVFLDGPL